MERIREKKIILRDGVVWEKKDGSEDCYIVFNRHDSYLYEMPAMGIRILELCNGQNTGHEIGKRMIEDLRITDLETNDIFDFLDELVKMDLVTT
ncbi:MAG: hypothetical protein HY957_11755 [Nitrospirae bacterium]|nr:hypothetical protein [Nitrospirota bacterium]